MTFVNGQVLEAADLNALIEDSGWIDVPLAAGINPPTPAERPQVRLHRGVVYMRGAVGGLNANQSINVGTIPSGYRPGVNIISPIGGASAAATGVQIITATSGIIQVRTSATASAYHNLAANWLQD